jgi:cation diffusion facilitator family transporter
MMPAMASIPQAEVRSTHAERYARGMRSSMIGLSVNLLLAGVKLAGGILGTSYALIADAIESLGDSIGSLVVWRGLQIAARPPDHNHPYGHGKAEPLAAALVAILIFAAAITIAVEAIQEIVTPHRTPAPFTLAVLLGVVLVKELLFRFVLKTGRQLESHAVSADAWHHRSDAITSGLAAVGITIALVGGPPFRSADAWAALLASGLILVTGWRMLYPAIQELMDHTAAPELVEQVRRVAEERSGVHRVEKLLIRKMGLTYLADMHLEVPPEMTVRESHKLAHDVKEDIQRAMPHVVEVTIHVEPAWPGGRRPDDEASS